jgi:FtsZ-binding cell division protein ZapB
VTVANINMVKIQQAIREFGSLQAAIEAAKEKKKGLETEIWVRANKLDAMKTYEAQCFDRTKRKEKILRERKQEFGELQNAFDKYKKDVDEFMESNRQFLRQYYMVEVFLAVLRKSPSNNKDIRELAGNILMMGEAVWKYSDEPHKLRWLFVNTVLGEHLHCYRCDRCGLKFIANQKLESHILGSNCPNCCIMSFLKADDSFLKAMLSSGANDETNGAQEKDE